LIDAEYIEEDEGVYLVKNCRQHGEFKTLVWKGKTKIEDWMNKKIRNFIKNPLTSIDKGCPYDCGLCSEHRQTTCTALIEVTNDCNLYCSFCFASAKDKEFHEPTLKEIEFYFDRIKKQSGICNIQLSGGEPTVRDDLGHIIKIGKHKGFEFIQINTNGIRIGQDEAYLKELKDAGLSSVYLQFDGTEDEIFESIRGRKLLKEKIKAIKNCIKYNIGLVLVPVIIPGVNDHNIGDMINFALKYTPTVRGIHFQPVSYFGRTAFMPEDKDRISLPELMDKIELQTKGAVKAENLKAASCENSLCSFNGSFIFDGRKKLKPATKRVNKCGCDTVDAAEGAAKAKKFVARNWKLDIPAERKYKMGNSWDKLINEIRIGKFSISAMAFQDAYNVDIERIKDCCIHVVSKEGNLIPFCIYNITDIGGSSLYRDKV
jgi:uncharacterized radical SAM superfamily Fe-S cluster-containing enzyme